MLWGTWETASTMPRHFMLPMLAFSVESAVDFAKEAAYIVLLEKDLGVLVQGVREGRTTFANTLKYVFMATSANFGNMLSMAGVSLLLPFLPLLPKQILLTICWYESQRDSYRCEDPSRFHSRDAGRNLIAL